MRLTEVRYEDGEPVEGYGPGFFRIAGTVVEGDLLTGPTGSHRWHGYDDLGPLVALAGQVDVLFIGTGGEIAHLPKPFRESLEAAGLALEVMSSPSAARTYNVLLGEGRRVALAARAV